MVDLIGGILWSLIGAASSAGVNHYEAKKNRQFQSDMSSTAHQRAMMDMRQAGLNPILAYSKGGASTPPGATAAAPDMGGTMNSAMAYKLLSTQLKKMDAEADRTRNEATILEKEIPKAEIIEEIWRQIGPQFMNVAGKAPGALRSIYESSKNSSRALYDLRDTLQSPFVEEIKRNKKTKRKPWYMKGEKPTFGGP